MANKWTGFRKGLGKAMMAFGSPDLYKDYMDREEEARKRKAILANIQAMQQGGLFGAEGDAGYVGDIDLATGQPKTFKMYSPEERAGREFQRNVGAVTQAEQLLKGRPTPATLQAMPGLAGKERAKGILSARLPQEKTLAPLRATLRAHPDIKAEEWQKGAKGTFERKTKGEMEDFDMNLTDKVISQLGTDKDEIETFITNIPKFKAARVDINKVMNALYKTATPKEKENWGIRFLKGAWKALPFNQ